MGAVKKKPRPKKDDNESAVFRIIHEIAANRQMPILDLESGAAGFCKEIRMLDSIILQTKHSKFEIVFLEKNGSGELDCYLPDKPVPSYVDNQEQHKRIFLKIGDSEKVWWGSLSDGRTFSATIKHHDPGDKDNPRTAKISLVLSYDLGIEYSS
jgi:hypothetical protein